ncbi:MAG: hypothetical protein ACOC16_00265 [Nanoarchaeota archaeon]
MKKSTLIGTGLLLAALSMGTGCGNKGATIQTSNKAIRDSMLSQTQHTQNIVGNQAYNLRKSDYQVVPKEKENKAMQYFKDFWEGLIRNGYKVPESENIPTQEIAGYKQGLDTVIELVQANAMMGQPVKALNNSVITSPNHSWESKYNAALSLVEQYQNSMPVLATQVRTYAAIKGIEDTLISAKASDATSIALWTSILGYSAGKSDSSSKKTIIEKNISSGSSSGHGGASTVTNQMETPTTVIAPGPWQP